MVKKITDSEWKARAKKVWGAKYDYSNTEYVRSKDKVTVFCNACQSPFDVGAGPHINSSAKSKPVGCQVCSRTKLANSFTKPFNKMVEEARRIHGKKYGYNKNSYKSALVKMEIICPEHGSFWQAPDTHINSGHGCKKCATEKAHRDSKPSRFQKLNERVKKASGNTVEMSFDDFESQHAPCNFKCKKHGVFSRKPIQAVKTRHPCPRCLREIDNQGVALSQDEIRKAFLRFGDVAELQSIQGIGKNAKIIFKCLKNEGHGIQETTIENLYRKKVPCPQCGYEAASPQRSKSVRETYDAKRLAFFRDWLQRAEKFHEGKYDYSRSKYINARTKIEIICPVDGHGSFYQTPDMHLHQGCRSCANDDLKGKYSEVYFEKNPKEKYAECILYYVLISHENTRFYKVGITKNTVKMRFSAASPKGYKIKIIQQKKMTLLEAFQAEQKILSGVSSNYRNGLSPAKRKELRKARIAVSEIFGRPLSKIQAKEVFS